MVKDNISRRALIVALLLALLALAVMPAAAIPDGQQILVWTAQNAARPGAQGASVPGEIALMNGAGEITPLLSLPEGTRYVEACGEEATSPNGEYFAFYAGIDTGDLYLMRNQNTPVKLNTNFGVLRTACLGAGSFQYSPDSARLAYVSFEPGSATDDFADGFLKVFETGSGNLVYELESVVAFDLSNELLAFLQFFTDDRGEADEVAVYLWDGSARREIATIIPEDRERCKFVSGSVQVLADGKVAVILGQDCLRTDVHTAWQLYIVDPAQRSATLAASNRITNGVTGGYQSFARTNVQYITPAGDTFLFTVPDAITANTASLYQVSASALSPAPLVDRQVVYPGNTTPANSTPRISLDGRWLAVVETSPNADNTLKIFDLNDLSAAPITFQAGSRGDVIASVAFTSDSNRLLAVVGGDDGTNNSIVAFNLESGSNFRVERGRFDKLMVVSPSGDEIVIGDTRILEDPQEPSYLNLVSINVDTAAQTTLFEGAVVVDGKVESQSFAVPLAWR